MVDSGYPDNYLLFNTQQSKNLSVVLKIEGCPDLLGSTELYTKIRYGDTGLKYGQSNLIYGGLRRITNTRAYMMLDRGLEIMQRIEPEQGRGNIGTITLHFIDKDGYMSNLVTQNMVVDEIMGGKECKLYVGYQQTSYPEDYVLLFRGYITDLKLPPGKVEIQISDPTCKKRQPIFDTTKTKLTSGISDLDTTIPVLQTERFYDHILGPDGTYFIPSISSGRGVRTYLQVGDEWMEYGPGDKFLNYFEVPSTFNSGRGGAHGLGTLPAAHDANTEVSNAIMVEDNPLSLMLRIMLSGWNGPFVSDVGISSFVYLFEPTLNRDSSAFVLPLKVNAKQDYGLTIGDYFTITGTAGGLNDLSGVITGFETCEGTPNRIVYTDQTFTEEHPSNGVVAFRSKYDTLPILAGLKMRPRDVDVEGIETARNNYFTASSDMRFLWKSPIQGKDLIDTQILLPIGGYGITRFGQSSVALTRPPLPGQFLPELNESNIIEPDKIVVQRATNSRRFYNHITYDYDLTPADTYASTDIYIDSDSITQMEFTSKLPIKAPGVRTDLGGGLLAARRVRNLLNRYKRCAIEIEIKVQWSVGSTIETGAIVLLRDEGRLKIYNPETGERNLGVALFEVIDRSYNIREGFVKLKLLGGVGFRLNDRYATISYSSQLDTGTTDSILRVKPSYGETDLDKERQKWQRFIGLPVRVHDYAYTRDAQTYIVTMSDTDGAAILVDPPLPFTPSVDDIIDVPPYPASTDPEVSSLYKLLFAFASYTVQVASGTSGTVFDVAPGDIGKFFVGQTLIMHKSDWSVVTDEIEVTDITGTTITLAEDLGFTPDTTYYCEGMGFADGGGFYRYD